MTLIGLCGPSGSGKTLMGQLFAMEGFVHIDCDKLVHEKVHRRDDVRDAIARQFGPEYLTPDGICRKELGKLVFHDKAQLQKLNDLLRQPIIDEIFTALRQENAEFALLDAPTLFESGLDKQCKAVIGMIAPLNTCVERIMNRDGIDKETALARLRNQTDEAFLRKHCHYILENDGNIVKLTKRALALAKEIKKEN